jgi:hypothetical protein
VSGTNMHSYSTQNHKYIYIYYNGGPSQGCCYVQKDPLTHRPHRPHRRGWLEHNLLRSPSVEAASQANIRIENKKKNNHVSGNVAGFFRPKAATTANMLTAWLRIGRGPRTKGKSTSQSLSSIQSTHHLQQAGVMRLDLRSVVAIKNRGPRKKRPTSQNMRYKARWSKIRVKLSQNGKLML